MEGKDAALQQVPGDPRVDKCFDLCIMPLGKGKIRGGCWIKKRSPAFIARLRNLIQVNWSYSAIVGMDSDYKVIVRQTTIASVSIPISIPLPSFSIET
jgi:hypothetical protein